MTNTPLVGSTFFGLDLAKVMERFWMFRRQVSKRILLIEFGSQSLTLAEARFGDAEVQFSQVNRFELPEGAVERGVPNEPEKMAVLLKDICREGRIYARRTAVVLPPEAAYTKLIDLPSDLSVDQARAFASDPSSGLQIPIPLQQTDFDLVPTSLPTKMVHGAEVRPYFLTSVPQKLVDQLVATLQSAELELSQIDLGLSCHLRLIAADIAALGPTDYLLVLELTPDCTHVSVVAASGPVLLERLSAIREFPEPRLSRDQSDAALNEALSAETITVADERYLPISDLDLRVLVAEVKQLMQTFQGSTSRCRWQGLVLTGVSSAHPLLEELLSSSFDLPAHVVRPLGSTGVGSVKCSQLMLYQGLGRLLGLGIGLLPSDALLACSLSPEADRHHFDHVSERSEHRDPEASTSASPLTPESSSSPVQQDVMDSAVAMLEDLSNGSIPETQLPPTVLVESREQDNSSSSLLALPEAAPEDLDLAITPAAPELPPDSTTHTTPDAPTPDLISPDPPDLELHEQWPSISVQQEPTITPFAPSDEEWPSLRLTGLELSDDTNTLSDPLPETDHPPSESTSFLDLRFSETPLAEPEASTSPIDVVHLESDELSPDEETISWFGELKFGDCADEDQDPPIPDSAEIIRREPEKHIEDLDDEPWPSIAPLLHNISSRPPANQIEDQVVNKEPVNQAYSKLTVVRLKQLCAERGLTGFRSLRKVELIELLISQD